MFTIFDLISLWIGRMIFGIFLTIIVIILIWKLFKWLFLKPYCPHCFSRKRETMLVGNNAGGHRCARCDTYYWYHKGRSYKKDPVGFTQRMIKRGLFKSDEK